MDADMAYRILGIETGASLEDIESAKRKLLQALHPDKHPTEQSEVFAKITRDVIEASEFLERSFRSSGSRSENSVDIGLEQILFAEDITQDQSGRGLTPSGNLLKYEKRYANDNVLAVAILSIDHAFTYNALFHGLQSYVGSGCALHLVIMNRTDRAVSGLFVGHNSSLIDDRGYQYSPDDESFYWAGENRKANRHSGFLAPRARTEGFVIFPQLRKSSTKFVRWFWRGSFQIDSKFHEGNYDVSLS